MNRRQVVGTRGEQIAARFLERAGVRILARNCRSAIGELDLVAQEGDEIVFVEVKTRVGGSDLAPDESVTASKLHRLGRLAERYLATEGKQDSPWRVDVIAVVLDPSGRVGRVEHVRGAFL